LVARPCLDCQRPTRNGSRCPEHAAEREQRRDRRRGTAAQRGYGAAWQRVSRQILERDGYVCQLCGRPGATTADHVISKANGGSDDPSNLVAAHRLCNSRKGSR
jgi:5-methylcytosine-specific restriction protein A